MSFPVATAREMLRKVKTLADYARQHRLALKGRGLETWAAVGELVARINHNRWVATCTFCEAGVALTPGWPEGRCFGCGAVYQHVRFPNEAGAIVEALSLRPLRNRNWFPHETLDELRAENIVHGVERL